MNSKFQEIIATPAMVVPAMTTEEINLTLLDASVQYIKKNITLETLVLLASNVEHFMGMRKQSELQVINILNEITTFPQQGSYK